jgi:hypothetical protein
MIRTNPSAAALDEAVLAECIEACFECAQACATTGNVLSRQTNPSPTVIRAVLGACAASCRQCGDTCEEHAGHHGHCHVCAEACRRCERACNDALSALASS